MEGDQVAFLFRYIQAPSRKRTPQARDIQKLAR